MLTAEFETLKYPVGKFVRLEEYTAQKIGEWIQTLETLPSRLRESVRNLNDQQLDTPYREGGWTIRQVVHHLADSHINSYVRFKLALTEDNPTIKPYHEDRW